MHTICEVYADGGVIQRNPSPYGGTWAWCHVNRDGARIAQGSGVLALPGCTNNVSEFAAVVQALEHCPNGWSGVLYSDSRLTLGRLCQEWWEGDTHHIAQSALWALTNLPSEWVHRGASVLGRLGRFTGVLLQGHPTLADLRAGRGAKRGFPVSAHNVWCDDACGREAVAYLNHIALQEARL